MPELNPALAIHSDDATGRSIAYCLTVDRSSGFPYATLRDSHRNPVLTTLMAKGEKQTRNANAQSVAVTAFAPPGTFFLRTKLLAPRPAPELLFRQRLADRLRANLPLPVTLVAANAGSGKTTLVADFLRLQQLPYVWYQLDHTDSDPPVFLSYLAHGIQQRVAGFGETIFAYLQANELAQQPERAADVLLNEILERVEQKLIVVL